MVEQAAICSIPIDFVLMRGQGIKLLSFIAKKCRAKKTLMPVVKRVENDGSYEGAICLKTKRGFYDDKNPVAAVDYASIYPLVSAPDWEMNYSPEDSYRAFYPFLSLPPFLRA